MENTHLKQKQDNSIQSHLIFYLFAVSATGFTWTLNLSFGQTVYCIFYIVIVDFIVVGIIVASFTWIFTNKYLRQRETDGDIEWGYCFDVHLNAFFPPLVLLHFVQLLFFNSNDAKELLIFNFILFTNVLHLKKKFQALSTLIGSYLDSWVIRCG